MTSSCRPDQYLDEFEDCVPCQPLCLPKSPDLIKNYKDYCREECPYVYNKLYESTTTVLTPVTAGSMGLPLASVNVQYILIGCVVFLAFCLMLAVILHFKSRRRQGNTRTTQYEPTANQEEIQMVDLEIPQTAARKKSVISLCCNSQNTPILNSNGPRIVSSDRLSERDSMQPKFTRNPESIGYPGLVYQPLSTTLDGPDYTESSSPTSDDYNSNNTSAKRPSFDLDLELSETVSLRNPRVHPNTSARSSAECSNRMTQTDFSTESSNANQEKRPLKYSVEAEQI